MARIERVEGGYKVTVNGKGNIERFVMHREPDVYVIPPPGWVIERDTPNSTHFARMVMDDQEEFFFAETIA